MAAAAPQPRPPGVPLPSPKLGRFWGHTLRPCIVQTAFSPSKALEVPSPLGGRLSVSNWRPFSSGDRLGTLVLLEFSVLTPSWIPGHFCPSPRLLPVDRAVTALASLLYVCTLKTVTTTVTRAPSPRMTGHCLHPLRRHSQSKLLMTSIMAPGANIRHQQGRIPPPTSLPSPPPRSQRSRLQPFPSQHQQDSHQKPTRDHSRQKNAAITTQLWTTAATGHRHSTDRP